MGRTLQKKKNRSGVNKVRMKPKSKKKILTNPIIAENWDKNQTLAQNYKRLGLTVKLNKNTGGTEKRVSDLLRDDEAGASAQDELNIGTISKRREKLDVTEAKIERDPATGKILRVLDQGLGRANPLNDPLVDLDSENSEEEILSLRNQHGNIKPTMQGDTSHRTETVQRLEEEAKKPAAKYTRRQPEGERAFVEELVRRHGDDLGKMARDMEINYMQRSEGDIKRRIKRWREAGGSVD